MIGELSRFRVAWDALIIILVFITCTAIPYQLAFPEHVDFDLLSIWVLVEIVFIIDVVLNFFTSYRSQGLEVTDRNSTVRHYLRG